jgi:hypothetical protein
VYRCPERCIEILLTPHEFHSYNPQNCARKKRGYLFYRQLSQERHDFRDENEAIKWEMFLSGNLNVH